VSDKDFSITINAYFNVKWRDPRDTTDNKQMEIMDKQYMETKETFYKTFVYQILL
jgi:hypothetical protein